MAKSSALRKTVTSGKAAPKKSAAKKNNNKKPALKVVKSGKVTKKPAGKKSSSPKLKTVKPASKKPAAKKPVTKNAVKVKPVNKAAKTVAKPLAKPAKVASKAIAKPVTVGKQDRKQLAVSNLLAKKIEAKKLAARNAIRASRMPVSMTKAQPIAKPIVVGDAKKPASGNAQGGMVFKAANLNKDKLAAYSKVVAAGKGKKGEFKVGCHVVYPTHGVGKIVAEENQEIGGVKLCMFVINFEKDKMTLRVPKHRAEAAGLRHISSNDQMGKMFDTLKGKAKTSRGMWSRRAQEYEAKINSGSVLLIAEVVRDLHQNVDQAERSYSERMIYESAFGRLAGELAAAESMAHDEAGDKLLKLLRAKKAA